MHVTLFEFVVDLYWTAPELLRHVGLPCNGTPKGDVYSFAIIMWELMYNSKAGPYQDINLDPKGLHNLLIFFKHLLLQSPGL